MAGSSAGSETVAITTVHRKLFDRLFVAYARSPEHPAKQRILRAALKLSRKRRIVAWAGDGWMSLDPGEYIQAKLLMNWPFEPKTRARVAKFLRKDDVFVDVGANVGVFSILAARCGARVIAIEPDPRICSELMTNLSLNGFERVVRVASCAVGSLPQVVPFGQVHRSNRGSSRQVPEEAAELFVPVLTLADVLTGMACGQVRLLKLDVEGAELSALEGLFDSAACRPDAVVFEYIPEHFSYSKSGTGPVEYLRSHGYIIETIDGTPYRNGAPIEECNLWARRADGASAQ